MLKLDTKKILDLPTMAQILLTIPLWILIFYVAYFLDYSTLNDNFKKEKLKEQDLMQQLNSIYSSEIKIEHELTQVVKLETMVNEWHKKLVNPNDVPNLLESILKVGTANGLKFEELTPEIGSQVGEYIKVPIKIIVSGGYNSIARFIAYIANMETLMVINKLSIEKKLDNNDKKQQSYSEQLAEKKLLVSQIILDLYYLPENTV